ncbi:hypothetical protein ACJJTC_011906 [Scirpophaga incertulas]
MARLIISLALNEPANATDRVPPSYALLLPMTLPASLETRLLNMSIGLVVLPDKTLVGRAPLDHKMVILILRHFVARHSKKPSNHQPRVRYECKKLCRYPRARPGATPSDALRRPRSPTLADDVNRSLR